MSGTTDSGRHWVGCCGYYTGIFTKSWLNINPTGHQISLRFHEFYRVEEGQILEMQAICDIPELMMQAKAWPMVPSLGREWHVPGPATQDGIILGPRDDERSNDSLALVTNMCAGLANFSTGGAEAMELEKYWHPRCNWYGPSGIGTGRCLSGFRNWHQIPFLNTFPDRHTRKAKYVCRWRLRWVHGLARYTYDCQWRWLAGYCPSRPTNYYAQS